MPLHSIPPRELHYLGVQARRGISFRPLLSALLHAQSACQCLPAQAASSARPIRPTGQVEVITDRKGSRGESGVQFSIQSTHQTQLLKQETEQNQNMV